MNKANLCWVFGDGRAGHEIQSQSLASNISNQSVFYPFQLLQPWKTCTPRLLPFFNQAIQWNDTQPSLQQSPQLIVTCGRQAAAVGKYFKSKTTARHIQILNPKDSVNNYDLIITPEHDNLKAPNVLQIQGSLHPVNQQWLQQIQTQQSSVLADIKIPILALFLGNPRADFYPELTSLLHHLTHLYKNHTIYVCGSRRTPQTVRQAVKNHRSTTTCCWFDASDGVNPYQALLAHAERFVITADSINMISETCSTEKPVSIVAQKHASDKQKRFIKSLKARITELGQPTPENIIPLNEMQQLLTQQKLTHLLHHLSG